MSKPTHIHRTLRLAATTALLALAAACTKDADETPLLPVQLLMAPRDRVEAHVSTRAMADGYSAYTAKDEGNPQIQAFFTQPGQEPVNATFTWQTGYRWNTNVRLNAGQSYYVYGFMPRQTSTGGTIDGTISSADYTQGATINLTGLSTATADDICIVVGAKREDATPYDIADEENTRVVPGDFRFVPGENNNYLYVLMNHIYTQVAISFVVGNDYARLRTIKLKRLVMTTKKGVTNAIASCQAPYSTISFSITEPETDQEVELFRDDNGLTVSDDPLHPTTIPAFFTPMLAGSTRPVAFTSTYDVYDKKGVLTRENCTATNNFTLNGGETGLGSGDRFTIRATIAPTYLYTLSDNDEDNPPITLK